MSGKVRLLQDLAKFFDDAYRQFLRIKVNAVIYVIGMNVSEKKTEPKQPRSAGTPADKIDKICVNDRI